MSHSRKIHFETGSPLTVINSILLPFPRLESLSLSFRGEYEPEELQTINDFENKGLKELFIRDFEESAHLLNQIVTCRNLSRLVLDIDFTGQHIGKILKRQPNLKFLHFETFVQIDHEFIFALKFFGRNLTAVGFEKLKNENIEKQDMAMLRQELQYKFPEFQQRRSENFGVIMKKNKNVNIHEGTFALHF